MAEKEALEPVQAHLPPEQVRYLKAKAELHGRSVSWEIRKCVHLAAHVENLLVADAITYITMPAPSEAA
jgi:plasmid stability protein